MAVASYGTANKQYLVRVLNEYRTMRCFDVQVVVLSNQPQDGIPDAEVRLIDLRGKNPYSLPFSHRQLFAERADCYDLFVYSEDDHLITEANIKAFLDTMIVLAEDELAGFLQFEDGPDGRRHYPGIHGHFHWDPRSVCVRGDYVFARLTNEHSACYILTQRQLKQAITSRGFLVAPHETKYNLRESAATDPYTQCGFRKLICISHLTGFLVHHLPNAYVRINFGIGEAELRRQLDALLQIGQNGCGTPSFFDVQMKTSNAWYSKAYYEPVRKEVISAIPCGVRTVLSIGCGWGAVESCLAEQGLRVVAVPLDSVIASVATAKGVEVVNGDPGTVREKLAGKKFDCLLLLNILHVIEDPVGLLRSFRDLLSERAKVVIQTPNFLRVSIVWRILTRDPRFAGLGRYERTGSHFSSRRNLNRWLREAGLSPGQTVGVGTSQFQRVSRSLLGLADGILTNEFVTVATSP